MHLKILVKEEKNLLDSGMTINRSKLTIKQTKNRQAEFTGKKLCWNACDRSSHKNERKNWNSFDRPGKQNKRKSKTGKANKQKLFSSLTKYRLFSFLQSDCYRYHRFFLLHKNRSVVWFGTSSSITWDIILWVIKFSVFRFFSLLSLLLNRSDIGNTKVNQKIKFNAIHEEIQILICFQFAINVRINGNIWQTIFFFILLVCKFVFYLKRKQFCYFVFCSYWCLFCLFRRIANRVCVCLCKT